MDTRFAAREHASPDSLSAAARYVDREYGCHGYTMGVAHANSRICVFEVRHYDGSSFNLVADQWGHVQEIPEDADLDQANEIILAMARRAVTR